MSPRISILKKVAVIKGQHQHLKGACPRDTFKHTRILQKSTRLKLFFYSTEFNMYLVG